MNLYKSSDDTLRNIFQFIQLEDIINVELTNKRFNNIKKNYTLFEQAKTELILGEKKIIEPKKIYMDEMRKDMIKRQSTDNIQEYVYLISEIEGNMPDCFKCDEGKKNNIINKEVIYHSWSNSYLYCPRKFDLINLLIKLLSEIFDKNVTIEFKDDDERSPHIFYCIDNEDD